MNAAQFSNALGKVNDKYIMEAITYERKNKSGWLKWGAMAACFGLILTVALTTLPGIFGGVNKIEPSPNPKEALIKVGKNQANRRRQWKRPIKDHIGG